MIDVEGINVKSDPRGIVVTLSDDTAFNSGLADIKDKMVAALDNLAEIFKKNPGRIVIEGHTDNMPVTGGRFKYQLGACNGQGISSAERTRNRWLPFSLAWINN